MTKILTHKRCTKCGEVKEVSNFVKDPQKKDGLYSSCKTCYKKHYENVKEKYKPSRKKWQAENREIILEKKHKRYYENRDKLLVGMNAWHKANKEYEKEYREKNKAHISERVSEWARKNKDRINGNMRKWRANHKDKVSVQKNNRRARENRGRITNEEWAQVLEKYGGKCLCCGRSAPDVRITMDHVLPLEKGGMNLIDNVQPLCKSCNSRKHTKHIDYR